MYTIKNSIPLLGLLLLATITTTQASQNDDTSYTITSWVSEGTTTFAHNASMFDPGLGNPTSKLDYVNVSARNLEFKYKNISPNGTTKKLLFGVGQISGGSLFDADYLSALGAEQENTTISGAHRFSYTKSDINGDDLSYFSFALGKSKKFNDDTNIEFFGGFQYWKETYTAKNVYLLEFTLTSCTPSPCPAPGFVIIHPRVITNEVEWKSFFVGLDLNSALTKKIKLNTELKLTPLVDLKNVDHHHLRDNNLTFTSTGDGVGVDLDFSVSYAFTHDMSLELGYRYWYREINDGSVTARDSTGISPPLPLVKFFSQRYGITLAFNKKI